MHPTGEHFPLQTILNLTQGFFRVPAEPLQHDKGNQSESDMPDHGLIHTALASAQTAELLAVTGERLDRPSAPLAAHDSGFCHNGISIGGAGRSAARLLSCFTGPVALDGCDAERSGELAVVS